MEKTLIWCDFNAEQDLLEKYFGDKCVSIRGSTPLDKKIELEELWREGDVPVMITKPKCFGFGMNWQQCNNIIFCGLSDSYEQYYQAIRRCYRFGQKKEVNVHIVISKREHPVLENIKKKEEYANRMSSKMTEIATKALNAEIRNTTRETTPYNAEIDMILPQWEEMQCK